jgi:hypothetical protein
MKKFLYIVESHFWYPVALLYIGVLAFTLGWLLGFALL